MSTKPTSASNWAKLLLQDAGIKPTTNDVGNIVRWMQNEEPSYNWYDRNNPLNASLGTASEMGLGTYPSLTVAAAYTAQMLHQGNMSGIYQALAQNADTTKFARAVIYSPWASSHYGYNPGRFTGASPTNINPGYSSIYPEGVGSSEQMMRYMMDQHGLSHYGTFNTTARTTYQHAITTYHSSLGNGNA